MAINRFESWQPADLVTQLNRMEWEEFRERYGERYFLLVPMDEAGEARITGQGSPLGYRPDPLQDQNLADTYPGLGHHLSEVAGLAESVGDRVGRRPHYILPICVELSDEGDDQVLVGRSSSCDMCLRHANVSKQHAVFTLTGGAGLVIRDLNSRNGTRVNGNRLVGEWVVHSGDTIQLGFLNTHLCDAEVLWTMVNCDVPTVADVVPLHV